MAEEYGDLFYVCIVAFLGGLFLFVKGFFWLKQKKLIENTPTSKIRSLAMGLVEIFGKVISEKNKLLTSPLTNHDCVYYNYLIEEKRGSGKSSHWATIKKEEKGINFYLMDETGKVLVDPTGAKIDIPQDFFFSSHLGKDPPESIRQFLKKNNLSFETFLGINKTMRYTEYFIAPNDKLYIMGAAGDNPFVEEATAQQGVEDIMIQKERGKIYYISDKPEEKILKSLKWKVIGGVFGGAILSVVCLLIILAYLGVLS